MNRSLADQLAALTGRKPKPTRAFVPPEPIRIDCPTGKRCLTKEHAQHMARHFNDINDDSQYGGQAMKARRCQICNYFHIGHRRRG